MSEIAIQYYGYVFDASGYGQAARAYIHALHRAGIELSVVEMNRHPRQVRDALIEELVGRKIEADFHLFHGIPPQWARTAFRLPNAIGMTVWETDVMPSQWRNALNHVMDVWLPCEFNVATFQRAISTSVFKLPHAILPTHFNGDVPQPNHFLRVAPDDFIFYSLFEWQDRKGPRELIEAFLRAFPQQSDAVLIIKTSGHAAHAAQQTVEQVRRQIPSKARLELRCEGWSEAEVEALHQRGDCYVSLHRGEGWCYPLFDAARRGTPVIATNYSGPLEYLSDEEHFLVRYHLGQVRQPYIYYQPHMKWAEPDAQHAVELMRAVYHQRAAAKARALRGAQRIQQAYSPEAVGALAKERLMELLERRNPQKWKCLRQQERTRSLRPAVPIAGDWYDADYFDRGLKSNWEQGYSWKVFGDLFRETAAFITDTFSEAESFMDAGCAKGLLVRALREQGKEGWGFDHSRYAIEHAEKTVKPFLSCASVERVAYDREFDVLTAFSLFESLTERQALEFLKRARQWTKQALVASIACYGTDEERETRFAGDADLSHITIKSRHWWHELFLRAGWRQDAVHRIAERICQAHALPTRMNWKLFVYAPGRKP